MLFQWIVFTRHKQVFLGQITLNFLFQGLLPIHCAAMQGRIDIIHLLLQNDRDGDIRSALATELTRSPPSLPHLSLANDFIECAQW